jgi:hypothetical protein
MIGLLFTALLLLATPLAGAEDRLAFGSHLEQVTSDLLDKTPPETLLRGLFDQVLSTIRDYVEVEGSLPSESAPAAGEFRLKLFPQGKSRSQEHVVAEGSFNLGSDADQQQLILRFKSSKPLQHPVSPPGEIL